ncbi:MAG: hypothetical protein V4501_07500 [Pseudomonadota bacterium]
MSTGEKNNNDKEKFTAEDAKNLIPDIQNSLLSYLADDTTYDLCLMEEGIDLEKDKIYVVLPKNNDDVAVEMQYKLSGLNEVQTITRDQLIETLGEAQTDIFFQAFHRYAQLENLKPFLEPILEILKARGHLHDTDTKYKAIHISGIGRTLFQPSLVGEFLQLVAFGKQAEAKKMLEMDPSLLLESGNVTNRANRTFAKISGLQYASWAYDIHMLRMLLSCVPDDKKADALEQLESLEQNGTEYGKHFDLTRTKTAYQTYSDNYEGWTNQQREQHWCKEVGGAQREWEPHMAEEMCFPGRPFYPMPTFKEVDLPRDAKFSVKLTDSDGSTKWFPLKTDSGLGFKFAVVRDDFHQARVKNIAPRRLGPWDVVLDAARQAVRRLGLWGGGAVVRAPGAAGFDLPSISRLFEVRAQELADIIKQLRNEVKMLKLPAAKPPRPSS